MYVLYASMQIDTSMMQIAQNCFLREEKLLTNYSQIDLREVSSGNGDLNQGNIILQIQKIRNVAAPKGNEESRAAPRMLKLSMTDGKNNFQALEVEHISSLR